MSPNKFSIKPFFPSSSEGSLIMIAKQVPNVRMKNTKTIKKPLRSKITLLNMKIKILIESKILKKEIDLSHTNKFNIVKQPEYSVL